MTAIARLLACLLLGTAALALDACAPAPASPPPARSEPAAAAAVSGAPTAPSGALAEMVEAARREGQLTLVYSQNTTGGAEAVPRLADGFNRHYGLDLSVQFTPGPDMPQMAARVIQQYQAGRASDTDVYLGSENHIAMLIQADALIPVDWTSWAPNVRDARLLAPDGVAVQVISTTPGITYNTAKVARDEAPTSLQDLLQPRFKGRIASTPYAAIFPELGSPELWGEARAMAYVTALADQTAGLIRAGETERLVSGEFDIFAINTNSADAAAWQKRGAPLAHVVPTDAAVLQYRYMGVPRNAPHPNAAKLWINYLLGREAQDTLFEVAQTDHYLLPGSKTAGPIEALQAKGVQFTPIDVAFVQRNDEAALDRLRNEMQRVLQKR